MSTEDVLKKLIASLEGAEKTGQIKTDLDEKRKADIKGFADVLVTNIKQGIISFDHARIKVAQFAKSEFEKSLLMFQIQPYELNFGHKTANDKSNQGGIVMNDKMKRAAELCPNLVQWQKSELQKRGWFQGTGDKVESSKFDSGNAQLMGGEFYIDIHPHPLDWLHFENSLSYVHSQLLNQPDSTRYLPFTPATKWISDIRIDIKHLSSAFNNAYFSFGIEHDFKQTNIYSAYNTETVTDGYTLLNAGLGTDVMWKKHTLFSLYVSGTNLADIAYQSHLSRLKYAPENYATGKTGVYNMGRNISLKLIVPVDL